jgi:hypothetical protein
LIRKGEKTDIIREKVSAKRIADFRASIGAAPGADAPPTFMTVFRAGEFELFRRFGIELSSLLHADQTYILGAPIRAGDEIEYSTELVQVLEKRGSKGAMHFMTLETEFFIVAAAGRTSAGTSRSVILYRESAA